MAGAMGTAVRYLVALWASRRFGPAFPYGTLIVNLAGCFAIAAIMEIAATLLWNPTARMVVTVGFLGGMTTYSSFNYETLRLAQEGAMGSAVLNGALTVGGGLAAGLLGLLCAKVLLGR